jgi:Flp pilus assembly protein TadD
LALALLPVAFVAFRNMAVLGSDAPLQANGGFNFYLGNGPGADGTCGLRPGPDWDSFHAEVDAEAAKLGVSKDRYLVEKTFRHIADSPGEWLALLGRKALYAWNAREITAGADLHSLRYYTPFQRAFPWAFGVCAVFALTALFFHIGDKDFLYRHRHFIMLAMAFFAAQTLLVASGRYRVGALPGILVLAAAGVDTVLRAIIEPSRRYLALLPSAALAAVVVVIPSPPFDPAREMGEACTLMGEALLLKGDLDNAGKCLAAAISKQPKWSRNHNLMGLLMERERHPLKAKMYYLNAVKLDPGDPEGYANLATLCGREGDAKHAESLYRKALSLGRPSPTLYYNYALFKAESGDIRTAAEYYLKCLELDPANVRALNNLAVIEIQVGNPEAAAELLRTAVRLDPLNPSRMLNLAFALLLLDKRDEAAEAVKRCMELGVDPALLRSVEKRAESGRGARSGDGAKPPSAVSPTPASGGKDVGGKDAAADGAKGVEPAEPVSPSSGE